METKFSLDNNHVIINYHYIENPNLALGGIKSCSISEFERQIKFLSSNFKIVSILEVFQAAKEERLEKLCALTFDDGLKDQYKNAVPILKKYKAPATFFIITSALDNRISPAHKLHILLSKVSSGNLAGMLQKFLKLFYQDISSQYQVPKNRRLRDNHQYDDILTANLKNTIASLPDDIRGQFLRYEFKNFHLDENKIARQLFMNTKEVRYLHDNGFCIGSHSHNHYPMDSADKGFLLKDLSLSRELLEKITHKPVSIFSYPNGFYNKIIIEIFKKLSLNTLLQFKMTA